MAKTKKEEVVEQTTQEVTQEPKVEETKSEDKITVKKKPSMKKFNQEDDIVKVNLSKSPKTKEDAVQEQKSDEAVLQNEKPKVELQEVVEGDKESEKPTESKEELVLEEVTDEEIEEVKEKVEEVVAEAEATGKPLPENIEKLVNFMEETGGDLEDYVKLNKDISKLDDQAVLYEYYKQTKPHLTTEEINFLMEDTFSYDEDMEDERDVKRKKLALKEQVASARTHLDGQKSKYYEEIKAGSKLTPDQQKAMDFFNRYNKESEETNKIVKRNSEIFDKKTNEVFNDKFKGFEYNVGDKRYRFNVNNKNEIKQTQSNINNFMAKFVDKGKALNDARGYHKSLFTAMNADAIAQHFYEQGKTDAIKDSIAKSKNVNMDPRQSHSEVNVGGVKVRVLGEDASDFKFKIKNKK